MRALILGLVLIALPGLALAQQAPELDLDDTAPRVQIEQTIPATVAPIAENEAVDADLDLVQSERAVDDGPAVVQDPTTRNWWWLVAAVVLGGIILVAIL